MRFDRKLNEMRVGGMTWVSRKFVFNGLLTLAQNKTKNKNKTEKKQGRIHGKTVADLWAGAVMQ